MTAWPIRRLSELAVSANGAIAIGPFGSAMKADTYATTGVPVIRGTNISHTRAWKGDWVFVSDRFADSMSRCNVFPDDLVFPHRGSIGEVAIVPCDRPRYMLSTSLMKISLDRNKAYPLFVYYFFRSPLGRQEILKFSSQVGTPGIGQPLTSLRLFQIPTPDVKEQEAVAEVLAVLDDKIDLNNRINATLEAMARAIFKDWLVDFGPVRSKMEGGVPYLPREIWSLFPDRLDDEGKPEGWELVPARDMVEFNPPERVMRGRAAPYLDMAALPTSGSWPEDPIVRAFASGSKFRNGDALLARITPCLENGKAAFVQSLDDDAIGWGSTEFIVMRARPPMPSAYAYIVARDKAFKDRAVQSMTGTSGRQRVQVDSLADFILARPSLRVAEAFGEIISPWFAMIAANAREGQTLAATRDLLLPKLVSGEIRVGDAERIAQEAAR